MEIWVRTVHRLENETAGLPVDVALARRQQLIREVDEEGIIETHLTVLLTSWLWKLLGCPS